MKLLDASAIFNLFQDGKYGVLLAGATIPLARYEIGNILWKNCRIRNRISMEEAKELAQVMFGLIDSMEIFTPSPGSTIDLALKEGLTFYDSSYLVAAMESGYEFVTDDLKLFEISKSKVKVRKSPEIHEY